MSQEVFIIYAEDESKNFILLAIASTLESCKKLINKMKRKTKRNGILPYTEIYVTVRKLDTY